MFNIVLVEPRIPPNTGNIIRLCANTGARLHLVEPLGFTLDNAKMRRAGLDYHDYTSVRVHPSWSTLIALETPDPSRMFAFTTRATRSFYHHAVTAGDWFVFGSETQGLSAALLEQFATDRRVRLPMRAGSRSLNLSNAVAIAVFEGWRQLHFDGS